MSSKRKDIAMMKIFVATCCLLVTTDLVHSSPLIDPNKWETDVRLFAEDARKTIRTMFSNESLCSDMKEHIIFFEEEEIIRKFRSCDSYGESKDRCYQKRRSHFHMNVNATINHVCNENDICAFWNLDIFRERFSRGCYYFRSWESPVKIWLNCLPLVAIIDTVHYGNMSEKRNWDNCFELALKLLNDNVRKITSDFADCKNNVLRNMELVYDGSDHICINKGRLDAKFSAIKRCTEQRNNATSMSMESANENIINCERTKGRKF